MAARPPAKAGLGHQTARVNSQDEQKGKELSQDFSFRQTEHCFYDEYPENLFSQRIFQQLHRILQQKYAALQIKGPHILFSTNMPLVSCPNKTLNNGTKGGGLPQSATICSEFHRTAQIFCGNHGAAPEEPCRKQNESSVPAPCP